MAGLQDWLGGKARSGLDAYLAWRDGPSAVQRLDEAFPQAEPQPGKSVAEVAPPRTSLSDEQANAMGSFLWEGGTKPAGGALDLSQAARMGRARDMGFDTSRPMFHGTKGDIASFDPAFLAAHTGAGGAEQGYFFTSKPSVAETYAERAPQGEYVALSKKYRGLAEDMKSRANAIMDAEDFPWTDAAMEVPEDLKSQAQQYSGLGDYLRTSGAKPAEGRHNQNFEIGQMEKFYGLDPADAASLRGLGAESIIPVHLRTANPHVVEAGGKVWHDLPEPMSETIAKAKAAGHDSVVFRDLYDAMRPYMGEAGTSDVSVVFDPAQVRSVHAKFDPAKIKSRDILAGLAPPALGIEAYRERDDGR